MATASIKRLATEQRTLFQESKRVSDIYAVPLEDNIFEWHFTILGPEECENFKEGIYHGVLQFSREYPFTPPDILFLTPNGRFELKTKICSSISSFHPEMWRPSYSIGFVLQALRLFMGQEGEVGVGGIQKNNVSSEKKKQLARESWDFECPICHVKVRQLWEEELKMYPRTSPDDLENIPKTLPKEKKKEEGEKKEETESREASGSPTREEVKGEPSASPTGTNEAEANLTHPTNTSNATQEVHPSASLPPPPEGKEEDLKITEETLTQPTENHHNNNNNDNNNRVMPSDADAADNVNPLQPAEEIHPKEMETTAAPPTVIPVVQPPQPRLILTMGGTEVIVTRTQIDLGIVICLVILGLIAVAHVVHACFYPVS